MDILLIKTESKSKVKLHEPYLENNYEYILRDQKRVVWKEKGSLKEKDQTQVSQPRMWPLHSPDEILSRRGPWESSRVCNCPNQSSVLWQHPAKKQALSGVQTWGPATAIPKATYNSISEGLLISINWPLPPHLAGLISPSAEWWRKWNTPPAMWPSISHLPVWASTYPLVKSNFWTRWLPRSLPSQKALLSFRRGVTGPGARGKKGVQGSCNCTVYILS